MGKMIIMLGVPGSGKSYLSEIVANGFVKASADDYFMVDGEYKFSFDKIKDAHAHCYKTAEDAAKAGKNVVIDNTNCRLRDIMKYMELGRKHDYAIIIVRPNNSWSNNPEECAKRNVHSVPVGTIKNMMSNMNEVIAYLESNTDGLESKSSCGTVNAILYPVWKDF